MRLRATLGALALRLDGDETAKQIETALQESPDMPLEVEINGQVSGEVVSSLLQTAQNLGRRLVFRPPRKEKVVLYTEVVAHNLRSGQRVQSAGTVVVLGDVNPGAEVIAGGDVIVVGKLRGLAHAGAEGNEKAAIWALQLAAKQLRIASHVAIAPEEPPSSISPERARVKDGQIIIEPWGR